MVEGVGFEPTKVRPADLQSAPFNHSGTPPIVRQYSFMSNQRSQQENPYLYSKQSDYIGKDFLVDFFDLT